MQSPAKPRTESDKLLKELTLSFGGKEYPIPVLRCGPAAKWRKEFFDRTAEVSSAMVVDSVTDKAAVGRGLMGALLQFPEKIPDLVFSYAPTIAEKRETIMAEAYDDDFMDAFNQIWEVAFKPFLASLGMVLEMQKSQASASRSPASLN